MTEENEQKPDTPVICYLKNLASGQDRAALAHLRRGLTRPPGESMEMFPYVGRFISEKTDRSYERAVFLTSALFADYWDAAQNVGDFGRSVDLLEKERVSPEQRYKPDRPKEKSIERRFVALLDAEADDLHYYLRQMVSLLKANSIAVNWNRLFDDIRNWGRPSRSVQRRWARSFWGSADTNDSHKEDSKGGEE